MTQSCKTCVHLIGTECCNPKNYQPQSRQKIWMKQLSNINTPPAWCKGCEPANLPVLLPRPMYCLQCEQEVMELHHEVELYRDDYSGLLHIEVCDGHNGDWLFSSPPPKELMGEELDEWEDYQDSLWADGYYDYLEDGSC